MAKHRLIELEANFKAGLTRENVIWSAKARELAYFNRDSVQFIRPRSGEDLADFENRPKVTSNLTYRAINELGKGLYHPGPHRAIRNDEASDSLYQAIAAANNLDALMQRADELSTLHGAFAIQVAPSETPGRPLALYPWQATEFIAYAADDDPADIWAVLVRSAYPMRKQVRYQLWDATEVRTYWTKPGDLDDLPKGGGREFTFDQGASAEHNMGGLPFVFTHARPPVTDFYEGAMGGTLAHANHAVDVKQSDLAQAMQNYANPRSYARNVSEGSSFLHIPGSPVHLVQSANADGDPDIFFRQPSIDVAGAWMDITNLINQTMSDLDIPLQARVDNSYPESGQAQLMRRVSLLNRDEARRPAWVGHEQDLARRILSASASLGIGDAASTAAYRMAAEALDMEVNFPPPAVPLPSSARDAEDKWLVENGLKSRLQILQERRGLTREQAIRALREIVEDNALEAQIEGGRPAPTVPDPINLSERTEEFAASVATA